jgi:hypothetical protein
VSRCGTPTFMELSRIYLALRERHDSRHIVRDRFPVAEVVGRLPDDAGGSHDDFNLTVAPKQTFVTP